MYQLCFINTWHISQWSVIVLHICNWSFSYKIYESDVTLEETGVEIGCVTLENIKM